MESRAGRTIKDDPVDCTPSDGRARLHRNHGAKVGIPAYGFAVLMGVSRVDQRKHFLSGVAAGAAIGYLAATAVNKRFRGRDLRVFTVGGPSGGRGLGFALEF